MAELQGLFKALDVCKIKIVKMHPREWGELFIEDDIIHINSSISVANQLRTLLHECLHWRWPNRTECRIISLETKKWDALKPYELRILLDALYPEEE